MTENALRNVAELLGCDGPIRLELGASRSATGFPGDNSSGPTVSVRAGVATLSWPGVGTFHVRHGREVAVYPAPKADEQVLRLFLLGPVLAVLLHQRGCLVLHASAVALDGTAIGFMGGSGWGKSTVAIALHRRGYALVADDALSVRLAEHGPLALPGPPELRLWPDTLTALGEAPESLPRLRPELEKRARSTVNACVPRALPLSRLYVLAEGRDHAVEALSLRAAVIELVRHTYTARLLRGREAETHLRQCAAVACAVPVQRLTVQRSFDTLSALAELVEQDCHHAA